MSRNMDTKLVSSLLKENNSSLPILSLNWQIEEGLVGDEKNEHSLICGISLIHNTSYYTIDTFYKPICPYLDLKNFEIK